MFDNKSMIEIADTKDKYIFWDIDGTLAAYRFNNHVGDPNGTENGMSIEEIENGIFRDRLPSKFMQNVIKTCQSKKNIIMSHCLTQREMDDKNAWLNEHYPCITERILSFIDIPKYQSIINYCKEKQIDIKDIIFVDDVLTHLRESERRGIKSYHITSFLDWNLQF